MLGGSVTACPPDSSSIVQAGLPSNLSGDCLRFIAQQSEKARTVPRVASEIARRLLKAGRAKEAWIAINAVNESRPGWIPFEWEEIRLNVMEALGSKDEAQNTRRRIATRHSR
jgi:hypothetical protein